ncbi:MAG: hypothetical protein JO290_08580, partial [Sphingomonadaceae bacterium]|nr:hypothetical protein [Sphingomonadaceae bacterium]
MFIIFDLDGTLTRLAELDGGEIDWDDVYSQCGAAEPRQPIIAVARSAVAAGDRVEIWTGRPERYRGPTVAWLIGVGLGDVPLRMRPADDHRDSVEMKSAWLALEPIPPALALDDSRAAAAMWTAKGVTALVVDRGQRRPL